MAAVILVSPLLNYLITLHNGLGLVMAGSIPCNEATTDDFVDTQK